jgi:rhodanese-related sulfurtransferase
MPSPDTITVSQLARIVGTPSAPVVVDVRTQEDFEADPRIVPGSIRRDFREARDWANEFADRQVAVVCQRGLKLSHGAAAWLRHAGARAESLDGAWSAQGALLTNTAAIPPRDAKGRTLWVTRARPKIDRIACPWLIRRFVDPSAVFLFVAASEVAAVADRFGAAPFDIPDTFWSHRGDRCTFDTMIDEFGLKSDSLDRLAAIVRGADTDRLDLAPQSAGLLAASLGLSRMHRDDLAQLDASKGLYDAFYRWSRDAVGETHNWPNPGGAA